MNSNEFILSALAYPEGRVDVVLDTDTYNEVDDQFALAYLVKSPERINLQAVYAAPFFNGRAVSPGDGMEKSYAEILKILKLCGNSEMTKNAFKGSDRYLPDEKTPVPSDAVNDLVARAKNRPDGKPLYVITIGAITNIASAILTDPEITKKIVVIWLGGHSYAWPHTEEFNMRQDIAAARVVFGSGVPVVHVPCMGMMTHLRVSGPDMQKWMVGKNELCDYLYEIVRYEEEEISKKKVWSRVIWDVGACAWLMNRDFTVDMTVHAPLISYDSHYCRTEHSHFMKYVYYVNRDAIFEDLFRKLAGGID